MSQFEDYLASVKSTDIVQTINARFYDKLRGQIRPYTGLDGISSYDFNKSGNAIVQSVLKRMRSPGLSHKPGGGRSVSRFTLTPFKRFEIDKKNGATGEKRPISVASISSVVFQIPTVSFLDKELDPGFSESSFGYRAGRSAKNAVCIVRDAIQAGYKWVLDADLKKFFDSVDHDTLMTLITERFPNEVLLQTLIRRFLKTGHVKIERHKKAKHIRSFRGGYEPNYLGIPQGGILSGLLANFYLDALDHLIAKQYPDCIYVRYADDFVVLTKTESMAESVKHSIEQFLLNSRKLAFNDKKTKIVNLDSRHRHGGRVSIDFLGYRFTTTSIIIKPKNISSMRARIGEITYRWSCGDEDVGILIDRLKTRLEGRMYDADTQRFLGRNWLHYFSLVSNVGQFRELDSFLVSTVLDAMRKRGIQINRKDVLLLPLPSFINLHYRMRRLERKQRLRFISNRGSKFTSSMLPV